MTVECNWNRLTLPWRTRWLPASAPNIFIIFKKESTYSQVKYQHECCYLGQLVLTSEVEPDAVSIGTYGCYLTNYLEQSPYWEAISCSARQETPSNHGRSIIDSTRACYRSLSWDTLIQSLKISLILSFHQRLDLTSGLFPSRFSRKTLYAFIVSPVDATCLYHLILLHLIPIIIFGPITVAGRSKAWTVFARPKAGIVG
jgi:hypothetical protein